MPIRLFSTDLDGTLLGNPESALRFKAAWQNLEVGARPLLVYNSGRLIHDMKRFVKEGLLLKPDYYIGGVGTEILDTRSGDAFPAFGEFLSDGWNLDQVKAITGAYP